MQRKAEQQHGLYNFIKWSEKQSEGILDKHHRTALMQGQDYSANVSQGNTLDYIAQDAIKNDTVRYAVRWYGYIYAINTVELREHNQRHLNTLLAISTRKRMTRADMDINH